MNLLRKLILILCLCFSTLSFAKEINVGDLIKLKIKKEITKDNLIESFSKFEIESVEEDGENYFISFRIYEIGKHRVEIMGNLLTIEVKSLLTEETKDISLSMENGENLKLKKLDKPFPFELLYLIPVLLLVTLVALYIKKRVKKAKELSPLEEINMNLSNLTDDDYYYQLSYALRKYIDRIKGTKLLSGNYYENCVEFNKEIDNLIKALDQQKFNPIASLVEEREKTKQKVLDIVNNLEESKLGIGNGENNGD